MSDVVAAAAIAGASGVIGALLGGILGAVLEVMRGREAHKARQYDQQVQRRTFERETLVRAQDAAARYADEVAALSILVVDKKGTPEYVEHSSLLMKEATELQMLGARIQDAQLRGLEREYRMSGLAVTTASSRHEADAAFNRVSGAFKSFNDRWAQVFTDLLEPPT
jgi:hypothetical protein